MTPNRCRNLDLNLANVSGYSELYGKNQARFVHLTLDIVNIRIDNRWNHAMFKR
jgi:hypothetical protein